MGEENDMTEQELAMQIRQDSDDAESSISAEELARQIWEDEGGGLGPSRDDIKLRITSAWPICTRIKSRTA